MKFNALEKIANILQTLDRGQRCLLFIGVLVIIFLLDYFLFMGPLQMAPLQKLSPQIPIMADNIKKARGDIQKINVYQKQVEVMREKVEMINKKIRPKHEIPLLLEQISRIATKNEGKINQIMPNTEEQKILLETDEKKYWAVPILVEIKTDYHRFGKILNQIENGDVLLIVDQFSIASNGNAPEHNIKLILKALVFEVKKP